MTQLYRITPKDGGTIKSVLTLKENHANPLTEGEKKKYICYYSLFIRVCLSIN
jgi:hypothetical protein